MIQFSLPLQIRVSQKKHFILNLNQYRNAHFRTLDKAKKEYSNLVYDLDLPRVKYDKIQIHYDIFPKSSRAYDLMNVVSVIDKFVCDAIVDIGIIPDDNISHIPFMPTATPQEPDKDNSRVVVTVNPITMVSHPQ
jgi:hypothetical protein